LDWKNEKGRYCAQCDEYTYLGSIIPNGTCLNCNNKTNNIILTNRELQQINEGLFSTESPWIDKEHNPFVRQMIQLKETDIDAFNAKSFVCPAISLIIFVAL